MHFFSDFGRSNKWVLGIHPSSGYASASLDISARTLKVEEHTWLIADHPGIMTWRGNTDISCAEIDYCAVVHPCAQGSGNDVGKMCSLASVCPRDGSHML